MYQFQEKHGAAYDWSPEEVIHLLSQISNLAASSFVYDTDNGNACKMAACGVRLSLMAYEAKIDVNLLPHVFKVLHEIALDCARIAYSFDKTSDESVDYGARFSLVHRILNLDSYIAPEVFQAAREGIVE
eukprot:gene20725-21421_t